MEKSKLAEVVLNLLDREVVGYEEYQPDSITLNVKDVNIKIQGMNIEDYIEKKLKEQGFTGRSF